MRHLLNRWRYDGSQHVAIGQHNGEVTASLCGDPSASQWARDELTCDCVVCLSFAMGNGQQLGLVPQPRPKKRKTRVFAAVSDVERARVLRLAEKKGITFE